LSSRERIIWQSQPFGRSRPGARLKGWLAYSGSLTARLQAACGGRLRVRVVYEGWQYPRFDEAAALEEWGRLAWVREIFMSCDDEPWVFARTVMPLGSLTGSQRRLRHLGTKPLGSVLFRGSGVRRRALQFARVTAPGAFDLRDAIDYETPLWARRSLLEATGRPLLVSEVFLPALDFGRAYGHGG